MNLDVAARFCGEWLPLWTGNRPEALLACYAQDAFYRDPAQPAGLRGHKELRPYFTRVLAANPDWVWEAEEIIPTAAGFVLKWRARIPFADRVIEETGLDIVEVDAGLITRNEVFFDRAALAIAKAQRRAPGH